MTKQYDSYKPSGVDWLGEIPSHWSMEPLKRLSKIGTGNKNTEDELDDGIYDFFVRSDRVRKINTYSFVGEAILTAGDGVGVGKVFHYVNGKFDYHQRVYKFSNFKKHNGKFLYWYIKNNMPNQLKSESAKVTIDSIRLHMLQKFMVPVLPIQEQTAIANYLGKKTTSINKSIKTLKSQKKFLIEQNKAIIHKAVTQGLDSSIPVKNSGVGCIGKIPVDWEVKRLKDCGMTISSGVSYFEGEKDYLSTRSIGERGIVEVDSKITYFNRPSRANMQPVMDSVWIAYMRDTKKMLFIDNVDIIKNKIISTGMFGFLTNKKLDSKLLSYIVISDYFIKQKNALATGTTQVSVNDEDFKNIFVSIPLSKKIQKDIVEYLDNKTSKIDKAIIEVDNQIGLLEEYKKTLINDVVTGKIKVI